MQRIDHGIRHLHLDKNPGIKQPGKAVAGADREVVQPTAARGLEHEGDLTGDPADLLGGQPVRRELGERAVVAAEGLGDPGALVVALRSGADAICEKPIVLNPWNIDGLLDIERDTGRKVNTILQLRVHPSIVALREKVQASDTMTRRSSTRSSSSRGSIRAVPAMTMRTRAR